ncbi:TPA: stressosome-associated protein Prli42 [Staphylococcus aureus]|uniref:stressosome-associated protein Prli42 n=1 Tax=Staphylococcus aureus TaxID=1280 RepID=UPI0002DB5BF8|nr:stressosome-associated protein Prli42 [Staphylococcus aureus]HDJ6916464.1 stressosome-associated protein Prli42 [Staphylococcus aureus Sa_TPS3169]HDJ6919031.1 stressosome-associated protein Prli42 [Staphylococcus aureus Sa_TPS3162]HDJ6927591.1 stressosome-associated protein Prli42 [Staphylococcus aureus Sa_TPS3157]HDJ6930178.1 stressosome-associated protein Prli42 [Staphylococcus aureus Sa_TPS3148]HDJ6935533.1 stressosome-associated protein Prli42 [Staphylococcus aureus Sa_TPS3161]HDJ69408
MLVISSQVKSFIPYVVIINTKVIHLEAHKMQNKVLRIIIIVMLVSVVLALLLTSIIPIL